MVCSEQLRKKRSEAAKKRWSDPVFKEMVSAKLRKKVSIQCQCGCGEMTAPGKKFLPGHNSRINHPMKGKKHSPEAIRKMKESHNDWQRGEKHPMFGKTHTPEVCKRLSESHKGIPLSEKHRKSIGESSKKIWANKSKEERDRWAKNISAGEKGRPPMNPEALKRMAITKKGKRCSPQTEFTSERMKSLYRDPAYIRKMMKAWNRRPNKPESLLMRLLDYLYPGQWKYTGDFSFTINGRCPDFVNCNGQKKIIELFGDYWHRGQDPADRAAIFAPFGYETLVIWEHELIKIQSVIDKIRGFAGGVQ